MSEKQKILIVEDEVDLAEMYVMTLEAAGFEAHMLHDGKQAIDYLQTTTPDIILTDLHIPGAGGEDIVRFVRGDDRFQNTRIAVISSDGFFADLLRSDVDLTLVKPVSLEQLRSLITRLHHRRAAD